MSFLCFLLCIWWIWEWKQVTLPWAVVVVYIVRQNCKYIPTHQLGTCWCWRHYLRWFVQLRCLIWKWHTAGECTRTSGTFQRESLLDRDLPLRLLSALSVRFWKLTDDRITMGPKPYPMHESTPRMLMFEIGLQIPCHQSQMKKHEWRLL